MSPRSLKATLHRQESCDLGEGPFWHGGQIWWVDIERGLLLSADMSGNLVQSISFGQRIGAAVPCQGHDRTLLVALEKELARLDLDSEKWETIARANDVPSDGRFNDGKCDPAGRFIVGTSSLTGRKKTSSLYSFQGGASLQRLRGDVSTSNGLAWSADGGTLYFIDTPELCVFAYDYNLTAGSISGERVVLRFAEKDGWPDGMTIDREGRLWIGFWDGWAVRCYRPETGNCEAIVQVPCGRATSCCFGGPEMDRLFITTARHGLGGTELDRQPLAGSLFVCDPETTGFSSSPFCLQPRNS